MTSGHEHPNDSLRCGNTIHSNYVTDHRCKLNRGHEGDCLFGNLALVAAEIEKLRGQSVLSSSKVLADGWESACDAMLDLLQGTR